MTDIARPALVALYDIRPGNGLGPFLQPRSPHGAQTRMTMLFVISVTHPKSYLETTDRRDFGGKPSK